MHQRGAVISRAAIGMNRNYYFDRRALQRTNFFATRQWTEFDFDVGAVDPGFESCWVSSVRKHNQPKSICPWKAGELTGTESDPTASMPLTDGVIHEIACGITF